MTYAGENMECFNEPQDINFTQSAKKSEELETKKSELLKGFSDYLKSQSDLCVDNVNLMEISLNCLNCRMKRGECMDVLMLNMETCQFSSIWRESGTEFRTSWRES